MRTFIRTNWLNISGVVATVLACWHLVGANAADAPAIPQKAIDIATDINAKSARVAQITAQIAALEDEKQKTTASAHALDTVLCADYGLVFKRVGTGATVASGLTKGDCPLN